MPVLDVTVTSIMTDVGTVVTDVIDWMGDFASKITSEPLLVIGVIAVPLCGLGAGMLKD